VNDRLSDSLIPPKDDLGGIGAPADKIEITPGMIDAGTEALALCEPHDARSSIVSAIYLAMAQVARGALLSS
jgi:hypothetical protein